MNGWLSRLARLGADLLFPPQCVGCRRIGSIFCPQCAQAVLPVPTSICACCGCVQARPVPRCALCLEKSPPPLALTRAAALFTEPLRPAIHALKYEANVELAEPLARYLVAVFREPPWQALAGSFDACIPVPLHRRREQARGYNQSALLARAFARQVELPVCETWLRRSRETVSQTTLSAAERQQNTAGAFTASGEVAAKRLLLVDDVITTGATLNACAQALCEAGASAVYGLGLATPARFLAGQMPAR